MVVSYRVQKQQVFFRIERARLCVIQGDTLLSRTRSVTRTLRVCVKPIQRPEDFQNTECTGIIFVLQKLYCADIDLTV